MNTGQLQFIILYGKTGSGKSEILNKIREKGGQVLDLEDLAAHHGSSFGGLGQPQQPSQLEFEKSIHLSLEEFNPDFPVWVEYESSYLGSLQIPVFLVHKLNKSKAIIIELDKEERVNRIIASYAKYSEEELLEATAKLKKKLSQKKYRVARKSIRDRDFTKAVSIIMSYYDKVYDHGLESSEMLVIGKLKLTGNNSLEDADQVVNCYNSYLFKSRNPE
jgi:tRNA 2-selenouridine synthase